MLPENLTKWRESASILIVTPKSTLPDKSACDYDLLMLNRSDKTALAQNHSVFPGGRLEAEADESIEWLKYFEECGIRQEELRKLVIISEERPRILSPQGTGCYDRFFKRNRIWAREISLRLTALRETFEEVGVLICRKRQDLHKLNGTTSFYADNFQQKSWQQRVHNDPHEFLQLCRELDVVPDLWSLHEWSVWASPAVYPKGDETAFFITFLDTQPCVLPEVNEVKDFMWRSPYEYLNLFTSDNIFVLLPQFYELSRLAEIKSFDALHQFSLQRSSLGSTLYLSICYTCKDAIVSVLPGDDSYIMNARQVTSFIPFDGTAAEFRVHSKSLHRVENYGMSRLRIYMNIDPFYGHIQPSHLGGAKHKL